MTLASVTGDGRGATDALLAAVVERLIGDRIRVAGALRATTPDQAAAHCESALRLLPDGPVVNITQELGAGSTACRMDAGALETAVALATTGLAEKGADFVVLNKFGVSEAEGRGFRALIAEALGQDLPVLIGVSEVHRAAFDRFADGMSVVLPANEDAVYQWCREAMSKAGNKHQVA